MQQSVLHAEQTVSTGMNQVVFWFQVGKLIGNVYNHLTFTNGVRITTAIVKVLLSVQQNTSVKRRRWSRYLLINTYFLTSLADEDTKCEKLAIQG